jgi:hypothetical protein
MGVAAEVQARSVGSQKAFWRRQSSFCCVTL